MFLEKSIKVCGQDYIDFDEEWKKTHMFSSKFERNMQVLIDRQNKSGDSIRIISIRRLVLITAVAILLLLTLAMTVTAHRELFLNFFKEVFDTHTTLQTIHEENAPITFEEIYGISQVPDNFILARHDEITEGMVWLEYEYRAGDKYFIFTQHLKPYYDMNVNTEGFEMCSITLNGCDGFMIDMGDLYYFTWDNGNYVFTLAGNIGENALIDIENSVQKVE